SSAYFFSISLATIVLMRLDVVIVTAFSNETQAGFFGAAARLAQAAQVIGLVWLVWLRPRMASAVARSNRHEVRQLLRRSTTWVVLMAGATTVVAWLAAPLVVELFGHGFESAVWPFRLLLLANFSWCTVVPLYTLLTMSGSERTTSRIVWVQLVLTVGLSIPLCHALGATGAAYAWAAGAIVWSAAIAVVGVRSRLLIG
ncbi:MAG: lipopolysaccharide biosynthesis protein, partial [Gemmatimonadaceae bacterium]